MCKFGNARHCFYQEVYIMAVCYNCKTEFTGKFCPTCGAVAQNPAPAGPVQPAPMQAAPRPQPQPVYNNISVPQVVNTTSVGGWIGWMFLCACLPLLGVIIMALAATDPSAKNFAKANLLLIAIGLIISLIILAIAILIPIILGAGAAASY